MSNKKRIPTHRQREILTAIKHYVDAHESTPTIRRLAELFTVSPSTVHAHVEALVDAGLLIRRRRRLILADRCPICGRPRKR